MMRAAQRCVNPIVAQYRYRFDEQTRNAFLNLVLIA
jgi:hypothetical protein